MEPTDTQHKIGDRVLVLHNIMLGNLIGTVVAIYHRPTYDVYGIELDGGGTETLHGFQLQPLPESERDADESADGTPDGQEENAYSLPSASGISYK